MVALASLTACSSELLSPSADYDTVVDVNMLAWASNDTLFFPVEVPETPSAQNLLKHDHTYRLRCSVRMSADYRLESLPMQLIVQQTDTLSSGHSHVVRNLLRENVSTRVRDKQGMVLGDTWGSLTTHEEMLQDVTLRFDSVGSYRMLLVPRTNGLAAFKGISAIGLSLVK